MKISSTGTLEQLQNKKKKKNLTGQGNKSFLKHLCESNFMQLCPENHTDGKFPISGGGTKKQFCKLMTSQGNFKF